MQLGRSSTYFIVENIIHVAALQFVFSPSAYEKSALAQSVIDAFPQLRDPHGVTGYVSTDLGELVTHKNFFTP